MARKQRLTPIDTHGVNPSKARGQNFLVDPNVVFTVVEFAEVSSSETVLEVGPGTGALTDHLAKQVVDLTVIDIEEQFIKELQQRLPRSCRVINGDIRKISLPDLFDKKIVVVSNVPYSISTEFCQWLFRERKLISRASLLLQKEFAERLGAGPGSRAYGSLSVHRATYATATLGPIISAEAFYPVPEVSSRLIRLDFSNPEISLGEMPEKEFEKFVRAAFSQKRKRLINCLTSSRLLPDRAAAVAFLERCNFPETVRAEEISPVALLDAAKVFCRLHNLAGSGTENPDECRAGKKMDNDENED